MSKTSYRAGGDGSYRYFSSPFSLLLSLTLRNTVGQHPCHRALRSWAGPGGQAKEGQVPRPLSPGAILPQGQPARARAAVSLSPPCCHCHCHRSTAPGSTLGLCWHSQGSSGTGEGGEEGTERNGSGQLSRDRDPGLAGEMEKLQKEDLAEESQPWNCPPTKPGLGQSRAPGITPRDTLMDTTGWTIHQKKKEPGRNQNTEKGRAMLPCSRM